MNSRLGEIWVYLAASPLLGLTVTLLAYQAAVYVNRRCKGHPLANPVLLSVGMLAGLLWLTDTDYQRYFEGAKFVHFLLGPATVALAIPLHAQLPRLRRMAAPLLLALLVGSFTAAATAIGIGQLFGASKATLISLAPKSVTTPIAMGISERLGGLPSLTAVLVIITGVFGAIVARRIYTLLRINDPAIRGFALGTASHGIGTARAFEVSEETGAFAALAMGLNGLMSAILLPWAVPALLRWFGWA